MHTTSSSSTQLHPAGQANNHKSLSYLDNNTNSNRSSLIWNSSITQVPYETPLNKEDSKLSTNTARYLSEDVVKKSQSISDDSTWRVEKNNDNDTPGNIFAVLCLYVIVHRRSPIIAEQEQFNLYLRPTITFQEE